MASVLARGALALLAGFAVVVISVSPAAADPYDEPQAAKPEAETGRQSQTVETPRRRCNLYASSAGFGAICSDATAVKPFAQILRDHKIDPNEPFCWDDPHLPYGFERKPPPGEADGRWWLESCLSFPPNDIRRSTARIAYDYAWRRSSKATELVEPQKPLIESVVGRGRIPFLPLWITPVESPRVSQPVSFSLDCLDEFQECSGAAEGVIETQRVQVGDVQMWARVVHLTVKPLGASKAETVECFGAGRPRTVEQLDGADSDPRVCRYAYEDSSDGAGSGASPDRYPAQVTALWRVYYDTGDGVEQALSPRAYPKTTYQQIRVTEVQTLVVS